MAAAKKTLRFYQNGRIATEVKDALTHSVFRHAGGLLAQRASVADEGHLLMGVSNTATVMTELGHAALKAYPYSPYGHCNARSESNTLLAFNGEPLDSATGAMRSVMGIVCIIPRSRGSAAQIILAHSGKVD
ncbi:MULTISPECIES: hypothetical protein [Pseudomonas putida group]|uniref:hypothetical protein n=1 Tax=Pseudomonas putida group TaxID=136845 RepID=UPI001E47AAEB|nr:MULTISPECIES: hypothetical protein [Pseudomonas putida group]MCE0988616.1 hypothetical protein [Pseudomonas alloputida]